MFVCKKGYISLSPLIPQIRILEEILASLIKWKDVVAGGLDVGIFVVIMLR